MRKIKIALIGFGTVARGLLEILQRESANLEKQNLKFSLCYISSRKRGGFFSKDGFDENRWKWLFEGGDRLFSQVLAESGDKKNEKSMSIEQMLEEPEIDVVIDLSTTNLTDGQPSLGYMTKALEQKKHVVTANKGPIALSYKKLKEIADRNKKQLGIEATVISGTPIFNLYRSGFSANNIISLSGLLNGTTNFILEQLEEKKTFEQALKTARELGYAEENADYDLQGWDSLAKMVILSNILMDANIDLQSNRIERKGITDIDPSLVEKALEKGSHYKLLCRAWRNEKNEVNIYVGPTLLEKNNPLAHVHGADNALCFESQYLEKTTIVGIGAGKIATAYGIFNDLLTVAKYHN